jgi:hypothetical protein
VVVLAIVFSIVIKKRRILWRPRIRLSSHIYNCPAGCDHTQTLATIITARPLLTFEESDQHSLYDTIIEPTTGLIPVAATSQMTCRHHDSFLAARLKINQPVANLNFWDLYTFAAASPQQHLYMGVNAM